MGHFAIIHFYPSELIALSIIKILCTSIAFKLNNTILTRHYHTESGLSY